MVKINQLFKSVFMFFYWLIGVFTWSKSFKNHPIIGNRILNLLGLHVARVVVSHLLFNFRLWLLSPLVTKDDRKLFMKNGFLLKQRFLSDEAFAALKKEMTGYFGPFREEIEGDTMTQRVYLTRDVLAKMPACHAFTENAGLLRLLRFTSSKNRIPFFHIENLCHHANGSGIHDPQKDMHADTFHPCVKAWLYIDDVTEANGPFVYVPGSQRLTLKRLKWEYRESLKASTNRESGREVARYWDGSFRVTEADLREMGCAAPVSMKVPANTLLIGNVYGFHRRGEAEEGAKRMTLWMQARDNPFNPLFSPFPRLTARVFEYVWSRHMKAELAKHVRSGKWRASEGRFDRRGAH